MGVAMVEHAVFCRDRGAVDNRTLSQNFFQRSTLGKVLSFLRDFCPTAPAMMNGHIFRPTFAPVIYSISTYTLCSPIGAA